MALFANSPRCNGASAVKGRPSVAQGPSSRQPVTPTGLCIQCATGPLKKSAKRQPYAAISPVSAPHVKAGTPART